MVTGVHIEGWVFVPYMDVARRTYQNVVNEIQVHVQRPRSGGPLNFNLELTIAYSTT
jgi:hypothetical protein